MLYCHSSENWRISDLSPFTVDLDVPWISWILYLVHLGARRKFKITTERFVKVPQWIGGLEHLAFLHITLCKLESNDVKILGHLQG